MNDKQIDCEGINVPPDIVIKAKEGDASGQLELGKIYYNAISIENNNTISFEWIYRAAEQGNMEAQFRLGDIYALGHGTAKSLSDSYKWYTKAAIQGYKRALTRIHNLYQQDVKMHCRGQINDEEVEWNCNNFKEENNTRELREYRLEQNKIVLNGAIEYYTHQFKNYQSSDQTDSVIQLNLAFLYQHGYGTKKFIKGAFELYSLAAEQGNIDAQYNLGHLYQLHTEKRFNYRNAFKWYTKSAQGGNRIAQRCLAYFYLKGLATAIHYKMAVTWYTKAAEAGDSQSQVTLGMIYRKDGYLEQDLSMAFMWYTLAARQGNVVAQNCLAQLYQRGLLVDVELEEDTLKYLAEDSMNNRFCSKLLVDVSKLVGLSEFKQINKLVKHALIGDGPAMYEIGLSYYNGSDGFPKDEDTGINWIKNAANKKHKNAQFTMAELYKEGESIEQDYYKSAIWYKKIAKKRDPDAQCKIGVMYRKGLGVNENLQEAKKWFILAINQENSDAQFNIGTLKLHGNGIQQNRTEAKDLFLKSAHQRNIQACFEVGRGLFYGVYGFKKNQGVGLKLLGYAAKQAHVNAQCYLGDLYKDGRDLPQDLPKSIAYYTQAADSGSGEALFNLAIIYLNGDTSGHNYINAYILFKKAKDKGHVHSSNLFQIPILKDSYINDYSKVLHMFIEVTERGVDDLAYNIGYIYQYGMKNYFHIPNVDINLTEAEKWYLIATEKDDGKADFCLGIMSHKRKHALHYYNKAVEKENSEAMYTLACLYLKGYDVNQDLLKAFYYYSKASTMGHTKATKIITIFESNEEDLYDLDYPGFNQQNSIDKTHLISMLEHATEEGYARLQYQLGLMYERKKDDFKSFKWFSLAADIGITDAYYKLGIIYEEGRCVEQNYSMAADMYQRATENDHEGACFRLGQLYHHGNGVELDYLKAYSFYNKAAEMDHSMAAKILNITKDSKIRANGDKDENFFGSLSREYLDSLTMFKYVAEHGDTEVQFKVGFAFEHCYLEPHYAGAFKWYSMAAKNSHREAMYYLGLLFEKGLGVSQDLYKAIQLYNQAYQLGSQDALQRLGIVYHHRKDVENGPVKAVKYFTLLADLNKPKYQFELGQLYEKGEFVQKNLLEALKWYTKAHSQGYEGTGSNLYAMYDDKRYEAFFYKKLFRNLSIASCNHFSLNAEYKYEDYGDINNRVGFMYFFGVGTDKNLKLSLQYFLKEYSGRIRTSIADFGFFQYPGFSFSQKIEILKEFTKDDAFIDQFDPQELYILGIIFYDGIVQTQYISSKNKRKGYTPIDDQNLDDPSQEIVVGKDYLKTLHYLKRAADKNHHESLFQLGIMYHCGYGIQKDSDQGDAYFDLVPYNNLDLMWNITILYHTHNDIQNFSRAFEFYNRLKKMLVDDLGMSAKDQRRVSQLVQTGLGLLYEHGDGVKKDYQKALDFYKKAADGYRSMGHFRLALAYYYGKGIPADYKKSMDLFKESVEGYYSHDKFPYMHDRKNLQTNDDDSAQKKLMYCTKTEWEIYGEGNYYLGLIFKCGLGIPKDNDKAQKHFRDALFWGYKPAQNEIKN